MKKTMLIGTLIATLAGGCCTSCNTIEECFGKKDDTVAAATCSHCGGTSCSRSCSAAEGEANAAGSKLVHSCTLDAQAQQARAVELKETVFSKATGIVPLPNGYTFQFQQPEAFTAKLEEVAAFERKCCATFQWEVKKTEQGQELTVSGDGAAAEIGEGLRALGWLPQ